MTEKKGFLEKIKDFFKTENPKEEPTKYIPSPVPQSEWVCVWCQGTIDPGERWSKFGGAYYHKQCLKQAQRGAYS